MSRMNEFDAALDRLVAGTDDGAGDPLVAAAARAREALIEAIPAELEARHVALMAAGGTVTPIARKQPSTRRRMAMVAIAAAFSVLLMGGSAVAASGDALPGDVLYGVKRAAERVDLALRRSPAAKAHLHLTFANRRLAELGALLDRQRAGEIVDVAAAMRAYREEVAHVESDAAKAALGRDFDALLTQIIDNLQKHVDRLTYLRDNQVPEQARDAVQRAIDNAEKAKERVGHGRENAGGGQGKPDGSPGGAPSEPPGRASTAPGRTP